MSSLESTHAGVYVKFMSGYYVIMRSDTYWDGLGSVLTIE